MSDKIIRARDQDRFDAALAARQGTVSVGDTMAQATRPAGADRYAPWWKVWLPIPLLLLVLDLTFNWYFWQIPKLSGSAADYSYQFLYDQAHLRDSKPPGTIRVLAFGSSVTSCFDPYQIQDLLDAAEPSAPVEVKRLFKPGTKPSDFRLLFQAEVDHLQPDIAVAVFNLVDFLNPSFERDLKPEIRYVLPPWTALTERWRYIPTVAEKAELAVASVSNLYRYRKPIKSAIQDHVKALLRWARSGRRSGHGYGWYEDGYTKERFGIPIGALPDGRLEYYIHPAWIAQRGKVQLRFAVDGELVAEREETVPGWKSLPLNGRRDGVLDVTANSVWTPRAAGLDDVRLLGVQLRATPPSSLNGGRPPFRYPFTPPQGLDEFLRMDGTTGDEYARRWRTMLDQDDEFGRRFRAYRDVKLKLRERPFEPVAEYAEIRRLVEELTRRGTRVLLINTPENPLLEGLDTSPFYREYLAHFQRIARDNPNVRFYDLHDALPAEDLNDWHHVNYVGQIKLGTAFAPLLRREIDDLRGRGGDRDHAL